VDKADPGRLAFPLRRGLRWRRTLAEFDGLEVLDGYASLFNGALFRADALDVVGVPDYRLFLRGDETEVHRRLVRSGLPFGTCLTAAYLHPQGTDEFVPIAGGRLSAQYPADGTKRYFTYRNRGYLMAQPGMRWLFPLELLRFGWFFLGRRDVQGLRTWLALVRQGRRERFTRP
jgi:rhamnopyranosyl-N-acetylglucosaminyl-diphospho-decaprenol beta-1,3/1,4-galactofuranosyltransferase